MTPLARLIVCEQTGNWAVALRRLLGQATRVYETRSLPACWRELQQSPASLLVVEWTAVEGADLLRHLARLSANYPRARGVVLGSREHRPLEWTWRESGAVHAIFSVRDVGQVVDLATRHLANAPEPRPTTLREELFARLPWSDFSTSQVDPRQELPNGLRPS